MPPSRLVMPVPPSRALALTTPSRPSAPIGQVSMTRPAPAPTPVRPPIIVEVATQPKINTPQRPQAPLGSVDMTAINAASRAFAPYRVQNPQPSNLGLATPKRPQEILGSVSLPMSTPQRPTSPLGSVSNVPTSGVDTSGAYSAYSGKTAGTSDPSGMPVDGGGEDPFATQPSDTSGYFDNVPQVSDDPYANDAVWQDFQDPAVPQSPADLARVDSLVKSAQLTPSILPANIAVTGPAQAAAVAAKLVQPSWVDKFLGWLGLSRKTVQAAQMAGEAAGMASLSRSDAAHTLVRRARNGDQNAMAIIALVRDNAKRGQPSAVITAKLMQQYIAAHPVNAMSAEMGYDGMVPVPTDPRTDGTRARALAAAVALSHGPPLTPTRVRSVLSRAGFGAEERHSFLHGMNGRHMRKQHPRVQAANAFGHMVGHAAKLQKIRQGGRVTSRREPMIGWELGEDE